MANVPNHDKRCIVHIDADAFFASVEQKDNPELKGKPVIIGHDPKSRGVVSTCSYEARAFGIKSAMPLFKAYQLCPNGIFVKPRMHRYQEVSNAMFHIFSKYSPIIEQLSVDEAFIDATGEDGVKIASGIRKEVEEHLGITVSAGISYCKYLAKLASDWAKPDGLKLIHEKDAIDFLSKLPVSSLPGIGPKTQSKLASHGITTVGILRQMPANWFTDVFGKSGRRFREMCNGIDNDPVTPNREVKSISEETTFPEDITSLAMLKPYLAALSQNVAFRLRKAQLKCKTVGIKIRFSDFSTITREHTISQPISSDPEIFGQTKMLLENAPLTKPVRLLGVSVKGLASNVPTQVSLFEPPGLPWDSVSQSMDLLRKKYGKPVLFLGASLGKNQNQIKK